MDIYSFFNSKDVAAHCRNIGKTWNTFEMAAIIMHSKRATAEKLAAWRELIENYPDAPIPLDNKRILSDSVHAALAKEIDIKERELALFKKVQADAFYKFDVRLENRQHISGTNFSCYEDALAAAKVMLEEQVDEFAKAVICVEKIFKESEGAVDSSACFEHSGKMISWGCCCETPSDMKRLFPDIEFSDKEVRVFDDAELAPYVEIPLPFKHGDILTINNVIFVLEGDSSIDKEKLDKELELLSILNFMRDFRGFFVNENGLLYNDHVLGLESCEYYRDKLEGNNQLLHYLSLYLKGEIDIVALLNMQCKIMLESQLQNNLRFDVHGCYIPEEKLAENRLIQGEV